MTNWDELFKLNNTVFHCETEELAIKLLEIAHDLGYEWITGDLYIEYNSWQTYKENTCYRIKSGQYCYEDDYKQKGLNIINVNELINKRPFKLSRKDNLVD